MKVGIGVLELGGGNIAEAMSCLSFKLYFFGDGLQHPMETFHLERCSVNAVLLLNLHFSQNVFHLSWLPRVTLIWDTGPGCKEGCWQLSPLNCWPGQ